MPTSLAHRHDASPLSQHEHAHRHALSPVTHPEHAHQHAFCHSSIITNMPLGMPLHCSPILPSRACPSAWRCHSPICMTLRHSSSPEHAHQHATSPRGHHEYVRRHTLRHSPIASVSAQLLLLQLPCCHSAAAAAMSVLLLLLLLSC